MHPSFKLQDKSKAHNVTFTIYSKTSNKKKKYTIATDNQHFVKLKSCYSVTSSF